MMVLTRAVSAGAALIVAVGLAGCGSSSTSSGTATSTTASPTGAPTGAAGRVPGRAGAGGLGGFDSAQLQQVQDCLKAAGVAVPTAPPSGFPSGDFTPGAGRPSGGTGGPGAGAGAGGLFNNPEAQAALKACGITLPTNPGGGRPTGTAT
ncbi:MAG: hypothetical protein ABI438_02025 [Dermatophilaceae bacterium]